MEYYFITHNGNIPVFMVPKREKGEIGGVEGVTTISYLFTLVTFNLTGL